MKLPFLPFALFAALFLAPLAHAQAAPPIPSATDAAGRPTSVSPDVLCIAPAAQAVGPCTYAAPDHPFPVGVDGATDATILSGNVTAAGVIASGPTAGFGSGAYIVTPVGGNASVIVEGSFDNVNWFFLAAQSYNSNLNNQPGLTGGPQIWPAGLGGPVYFDLQAAAFVRIRATAVSGTSVSGQILLKRGMPARLGYYSFGSTSVVGNLNISIGFNDSTTALGASATFTGTARAVLSQASFFGATVFADQAGTLQIQQSLDSAATWQPVASVAVVANAAQDLNVRVRGSSQYRVVYINGASAQTVFRLSSSFTAN